MDVVGARNIVAFAKNKGDHTHGLVLYSSAWLEAGVLAKTKNGESRNLMRQYLFENELAGVTDRWLANKPQQRPLATKPRQYILVGRTPLVRENSWHILLCRKQRN